MAKRKRLTTRDKIEEQVRKGIGQGVGEEYIPWIKIQDVASRGRVTRLKGIKTNRQHEFLSDMERDYFYLLEYSDKVIDIREQFPLLPLELTEEIAEEVGIRHPSIKENGENIVMTTDFFITIEVNGEQKYIARTIKPSDDLMNERVMEKFEIERVYWERKGIDWGIVTQKEISKIAALNISSIHSYYDIEMVDAFKNIDYDVLLDMIEEYLRRIIGCEENIRTLSNIYDEDFNLPKGSGLSIFKHLAIKKIIDVDLFIAWDFSKMNNISLNTKHFTMERKIV